MYTKTYLIHPNERLYHIVQGEYNNIAMPIVGKILDNTFLDENVPNTLTSKHGKDLSGYTNGELFRVKEARFEGELLFTYIVFAEKDGYLPVSESLKYLSNSKVDLKSIFEHKIEAREFMTYYTIYDYLSTKYLGQEWKDPSDIDFEVETIIELQQKPDIVQGDLVKKIFYAEFNEETKEFSIPVLEKVYTTTRESKLPIKRVKDFYWYKSDGSKEKLKTKTRNIYRVTDQETREKTRRSKIVDELKAEIRNTPLEAPAFAWFDEHISAISAFIDTGSEEFYNAINTEVTSVETWLLVEYQEGVTIQQAILNYLNIYS